jgi:hypothetical protein
MSGIVIFGGTVPSAPQRDDIDRGPGRLQGSPRNDELDLLEAVGRQAGDPAALEPASGGM